MSIEKTFDPLSAEILNPGKIFKKREGFPERAVATFAQKNMDIILRERKHEIITKLHFGQEGIFVYKVSDPAIGEFAAFFSPLGGAAAATQLEEVIGMGGKKFIYFGSCGGLDKSILPGSIVVPTAAYRDEGTSYHYMEAGDFIDLDRNEKCISVMEGMGISPLVTKVWTTDALYRETVDNVRKRKAAGCKAVDMECASLAAVAKYRGVEFCQFLYTEDNLGGECWDPGLLGKFNGSLRECYVAAALEILKNL